MSHAVAMLMLKTAAVAKAAAVDKAAQFGAAPVHGMVKEIGGVKKVFDRAKGWVPHGASSAPASGQGLLAGVKRMFGGGGAPAQAPGVLRQKSPWASKLAGDGGLTGSDKVVADKVRQAKAIFRGDGGSEKTALSPSTVASAAAKRGVSPDFLRSKAIMAKWDRMGAGGGGSLQRISDAAFSASPARAQMAKNWLKSWSRTKAK